MQKIEAISEYLFNKLTTISNSEFEVIKKNDFTKVADGDENKNRVNLIVISEDIEDSNGRYIKCNSSISFIINLREDDNISMSSRVYKLIYLLKEMMSHIHTVTDVNGEFNLIDSIMYAGFNIQTNSETTGNFTGASVNYNVVYYEEMPYRNEFIGTLLEQNSDFKIDNKLAIEINIKE